MPLADWTIGGTGSYTIVTDGTSPGTNTSVVHFNGEKRFIADAAGTIQDARIETWVRLAQNNNTANPSFAMRLRGGTSGLGSDQADAELGSGGTKGDGYQAEFSRVSTNADPSLTTMNLAVQKCVSSAVSVIIDTVFTVTDSTAWNKYRFSAYSSGLNTFLRVEWWNGSSFIVVAEASDGNPTLLTRSNWAVLHGAPNASNGTEFFDDTAIYSLA
jgi:hypothetical protein